MKCPMNCCKDVSKQGMNKHIFSEAHKVDLESLVLARKKYLDRYVADYESKLITYLPYVQPDPKNHNNHLNICFGCEKTYAADFQKAHTCPKFKEGIEILKKILSTQSTPEMPEVSANTSDLQSQIDALKKQVLGLQKKAELDKKIVDKAMDMEDALFGLLNHLHENDSQTFNTNMHFLKDNHQTVFSKMCEDLDIPEDLEVD